MIITYLVLIPLFILTLWLFFKYTPKAEDVRRVKIYNNCTLLLAVVISAIMSLVLRASMIHGSDAGWWPVLAFVFSLMISIAIIFLSGIFRNFILFRNRE